MNNADKPIYPSTEITTSDVLGHELTSKISHIGLTKREYASMVAMQGLIAGRWACPDNVPNDPKTVAEESVKYADELLKQLET